MTCRLYRKITVDRLVKKEYWNGFFAALGHGMGPEKPLRYEMVSAWYNEVAEIAYKAGYLFGAGVLAAPKKRYGSPVDRRIPGGVYAEAYGAARLA
jgi:hypothetical protein